MLGRYSYEKPYINACRAKAAAQIAAYQAVGASPQLAAFEPQFLHAMILELDAFFVHRLRKMEGKDGNPLNEVRMLCNAILLHGGVFEADSTIKYDPTKSVLGLKIGEPVGLDVAGYKALAKAFFAEIEAKYVG